MTSTPLVPVNPDIEIPMVDWDNPSKAEVIAQIQAFYARYSKVPSTLCLAREVQPKSTYSRITRLIGPGSNWYDVIRIAGLSNNRLESKSDQEMLADLHALYVKLGRTPRLEDVRVSKNMYSYDKYRRRFARSWHDILLLAGITPDRGVMSGAYTKEQLQSILISFAQEHGRAPKYTEVGNKTIPTRTTFEAYFGKPWADIMFELGIDMPTRSAPVKADHSGLAATPPVADEQPKDDESLTLVEPEESKRSATQPINDDKPKRPKKIKKDKDKNKTQKRRSASRQKKMHQECSCKCSCGQVKSADLVMIFNF